MRKKILYLIILILAIGGCSASKKALKQAREYEAAGLYVKAAEQDLKALREKRNFKEALVHLKEMAPRAYDELLDRAANLEKAENWDRAVAEYKHLDYLLGRFHQHGVVFETVNVKERLHAARKKAAERHYQNAEDFFKKKRWQKAANAYLKAHEYIDNYNNSLEKAIQSFLNSGNRFLAQKEFNQAINAFHKILDVAPNHTAAKRRLAESHYLLGQQHFDEGNYREALAEFEMVQDGIPGYRDVDSWAQRAYDAAVQYVGIFPFVNESSVPVNGYLIASEINSRVQPANLEFADFLPHPEIVVMVDRFELNRSGRFIEAEVLNVARKEELDAIVWGKVRDVRVRDEAPSFVEVEYEKPTVTEDSLGNDVETTETIYFREYKTVRQVRVKMEFMILDTGNGQILERHRYDERVTDTAVWIAHQGSIYDLPKEKRALLDAPRDPHPVDFLVTGLIEKISKKIGKKVVDFYR